MFKILNDLMDFIFPPFCAICGRRLDGDKVVCNRCFGKTYFVSQKRCRICGMTVKSRSICKECKKDPPNFDFVIGCGSYVTPLSNIIKFYKYNHRPSLSERLARMLYSSYLRRGDVRKIEIVTWVPMQWVGIRERGYNQSRLLAENFSAIASLRSMPLLKKIRNIPSQTKLSYKDRLTNVRNAYKVERRALDELSRDLNNGIILVDDVLTTAATLNECARALKEAGFSRVIGLVLAISP